MGFDANVRGSEQLLHETLDGGWKVVEKVVRPPCATGSTFSTGYIVEKDGRRGFLKASDFHDAVHSHDVMGELWELSRRYVYERDLCKQCANKYLKNVVTAVAYGEHRLIPADLKGHVSYIIFELAEGDIRKHLDKIAAAELPWRLRALHQVAVGLQQLHSADIAHQDLKPSNVLVFTDKSTKIADLGRASSRSLPSPFDGLIFPGDHRYAPPEALYRYVLPDWKHRRFGTDLYMLGSLIVFTFTKTTMTAAMLANTHAGHHPKVWGGSFAEVLPHLRQAFDTSVEAIAKQLPPGCGNDILPVIRQLCDPDPHCRGHPQEKSANGNPQSVLRYISFLDVLAVRFELLAKRSTK
jgi:serine/threonine protein kinase